MNNNTPKNKLNQSPNKLRKTRQIPLRLVLIVPFILQIVAAVGLVGYLSYRSGKEAVEDMANQLMDQATNRVHDRLDTSLQNSQEAIKINYLAAQQGRLNIKDFEQLRQHFWQQTNLTPTLAVNGYISEEGKLLAYGRILSQNFIKLSKIKEEKEKYIGKLYLVETISIKTKIQNSYTVDRDGKPLNLISSISVDQTLRPPYLKAKAAKKQAWSNIFASRFMPSLMINRS